MDKIAGQKEKKEEPKAGPSKPGPAEEVPKDGVGLRHAMLPGQSIHAAATNSFIIS